MSVQMPADENLDGYTPSQIVEVVDLFLRWGCLSYEEAQRLLGLSAPQAMLEGLYQLMARHGASRADVQDTAYGHLGF